MNRRFFDLYQYLAPAILFPVSYYLWVVRYDGNHSLVILALSMPIIFAYVIPGIGTNWLRLWEFNTRWKVGRFRPHHGFVFGTAASLIALLCVEFPSQGIEPVGLFKAGFIMGSVLAFWNWLYDIYAIRAGFIVVHLQPFHKGAAPETIATEYAPVLFGTFGACYGVCLYVVQYYLIEQNRTDLFWWLFLIANLAVLIIPVVAIILFSYARHGVSGLRTYGGNGNEK